MPQMDGSIRIGTKIETKEAERELKSLESSITKTADKIASLRSKMDALKDAKLPTQEYQEISTQIAKAEEKFNKLLEKQEQMKREGKDSGVQWQRLQDEIEQVGNTIRYAQGELKDLADTGKAFTLGANTEEYAQMTAQIEQLTDKMQSDQQRAAEIQSALTAEEERLAQIKSNATVSDERIIELLERKKQLVQEIADMERAGVGLGYKEYDLAQQELSGINDQLKEYKANIDNIPERFSKARNAVAGAFNALASGVRKGNALIDHAFANIGRSAKKTFDAIAGGTKKANASLSGGFKTVLKYGFGIRSLYVLFNKIRSGIKEGFTNFMNYSSDFANSIQSMKNSMSTLSNQIAAAFAPIVQMVIPWLTKLISVIATAMTYVAQFIAILGGKSTFTRAKQVQDGYNKSLGGTAAAAKKAYGALAKFDDLDVLQKQDEDSDVGGSAAGAVGDLFEEVPVDDWMKDFVDKFKDILSKLFYPLKEAWKREGQFVMDAWKYALNEVWKLIKDIGRDFLIMWQEEATIRIFQDILHIIGDIGLVVGHLARNFREAWNENETGLNILRNIRDIFGIIVRHIRNAADATVEWADKLDFRPLLKAINRFLESMKPLVDAVWGVLEDFYTKVLLPLSKWALEKGLPDLLQVFIDFNEKVDWASLRQSLAEFWEHLEPFAETVGEGLIIFIERVSDALAGFLNSQEFNDFLKTVEDWMDSVTPQDVADALETIAKSLITLKVALLGFSAISAVTGVLTTIKTFLSFFGVGGAGAGAAGSIEATSTALSGFVAVLSDFAIASTAAVAAIEPLKNKIFDLAEANGAQSQTVADAKDKYDGFTGTLRLVKDEVQGLLLGMEGLPTTIASSVGSVDALNKAMEAAANGTIYTDAQVEKMRQTWGFTADDIEMLRQEMLDANPALRSLADAFPELANASAESLEEISAGLYNINNGIVDVHNGTLYLAGRFGTLTDETKAFFDGVADGTIPIGQSINDVSASIDDFSVKVNKAGESMSSGFAASAEAIAGTAADIVDTAIESGENIGKGVSEGMMKADFTAAAKSLFDAALTAFNAAAGINSPAENMKPSGEYITLGIVEGMLSAKDQATEAISGIANSITEGLLNGIAGNISQITELWNNLKENTLSTMNVLTTRLSSILNNITNLFTKSWQGITLTFQTFSDYINGTFITAWREGWSTAETIFKSFDDMLTAIVSAITLMFDNFFNKTIKNFVDVSWKGAWENAKNIFVSFKDKISEITDQIKGILESFLGTVSDIVSKVMESINKAGSASSQLKNSTSSYSVASYPAQTFAAFTNDIPRLASGSVIRGGNPFLAMLGDQPHGQTNVEAPLSTIEQAVENVMNRRGNGSGVPVNINLNWNGETFARVSLPDFLAEMARQGYDVDVLGVT